MRTLLRVQECRSQGKSSSTPVTGDLSKTFHQICPWLHLLVKTKKSTEDSVIYLLGNPQRDVGDWLTLINKVDTIATCSILTATCQKQLLETTPNHACPCVCRLQYRTKNNKPFQHTSRRKKALTLGRGGKKNSGSATGDRTQGLLLCARVL